VVSARCQFDAHCGPSCYRCTRCWQEVITDTLPIYAACRGYRGAGHFLSRSLSWFGLRGSENCKCRARARLMDQRGPDWCEENLPEVLEWLREAAEERGLPFVEAIATLFVRRAIAKDRRAARNPPS
jgi:hypothetical protein